MVLSSIDKLDFYSQFKNWYFKIVRSFKFDYQKDIEAANLLSEILKEKAESWKIIDILISFQNYVQSKKIIFIYGCGPTLEETVLKLKHYLGLKFFSQTLNLAADGASVFLRETDIPIDAIFSDLDGISEKEFEKAKYMIVHAHGDNIDKILKYKSIILKSKNLIGTIQVDPSNLTAINPGGFTDGDRILFFLRSLLLPQHKVFLIGMDFNKVVGRYSKPDLKKSEKATNLKRKKLKFAFKLIKWLQNLIKNEFIFINSNLKSKYFKNLSIEEFVKQWAN